jgi:hypothetical protein
MHSADTVDLEIELPHSSSVMAETLRVDSPLMTISIIARTSACSLRWKRWNNSVLNSPLRSLGTVSSSVPTLVCISRSRYPLRYARRSSFHSYNPAPACSLA